MSSDVSCLTWGGGLRLTGNQPGPFYFISNFHASKIALQFFNTYHQEIAISEAVSGRVVAVVVVVRELFSLVTSAICVRRVRGYEDCLPHDKFFVYCCVLTTVNS